MKKFCLALAVVLLAIPVWADDLQPEFLGQEVKEYNALSTGDIDPGNHEIWKLYICGELYSNNYNHEKETYIARLVPKSPYVVYLRINQLYNFLQPLPKVGDVVAVEGRVLNHFYSTIEGPVKTYRIPVLYMYIENASKLPFEPAAAAVILGSQATPTVGVPRTAAASVTTTPGSLKPDAGTSVR